MSDVALPAQSSQQFRPHRVPRHSSGGCAWAMRGSHPRSGLVADIETDGQLVGLLLIQHVRRRTVEKINESYIRRVLRLTLLAPDIVEAILEGRQSAEITLAVLMRPFAVQRKTLIGCLPRSPACLDAMP
jgi:hypothetical protein